MDFFVLQLKQEEIQDYTLLKTTLTSVFRLLSSDFRLPSSDFRLLSSDFRLLTSYFILFQ